MQFAVKTQEPYANQPGRFYTSAVALIHYIYLSWFAIQKRLQYRIERKQHWLEMLKSDAELEQECGQTIEQIQAHAEKILKRTIDVQAKQEAKDNKKKGRKKKKDRSDNEKSLFNTLFKAYEESTEPLTRCAIVYLLKNNSEIPETEEDTEQYAQRRRRKEIEVERLKAQLQSRLPNSRDLTGEQWAETLSMANNQIPLDSQEQATWQAKLLTKPSSIPFPVSYETNTDLTWLKDQRGHLLVNFNGIGKHPFEIRCDQRHLHWFQRFFEDQEIKKQNDDQYSSAVFALRSARLLWREEQGKGDPWIVHTLYLQCSIDTRFWTAEGTQQIAEVKALEAQEKLENLQKKGELNSNQEAFQKRQQSLLTKINTPFPRPHKQLYQGDNRIIVGVSLGLEKPATIAVVNATSNQVLTYKSIKQLLGKNYPLLNRQRQQKQKLSHLRHQAQKIESFNQFGESELGEYIDRLIAKAIVEIAQTYRAGSIVVPNLKQIREIIR